jgi:acyl-CoA synthetase (AMP-forming)/AMP-acid ligase II
VGIFLPGVEGLIEQDLSPEGSLSIRSDSLATGVAKYNPSTGTYSHEYLAKEGFFETNDLVAMDAEGRIKLVGRVDDLVVLGGLNFNLLEIEEAALSYPGIVAACAFAPFGGSVSDLHLVVETSYENLNFSVEALMGHLKHKLGTSWPRRISRGLIVRTHNGKIDRRSTGSLFTNGAQL